jgi:hypothetical protein
LKVLAKVRDMMTKTSGAESSAQYSLLELIPRDETHIGWRVISPDQWDDLARLMQLPASARMPLVEIIAWARKQASPKPGEGRKQLARLQKLALKLADGLRGLDESGGAAILMAMSAESKFAGLPLIDLPNAAQQEIENAEALAKRLGEATKIARQWRAPAGGDQSLRRLVERLDGYLVDCTGEGLIRASLTGAKTARARGDRCEEFVRQVAALAGLGGLSSGAVSDAMKDAISARRKVGRLGEFSIATSPQTIDCK